MDQNQQPEKRVPKPVVGGNGVERKEKGMFGKLMDKVFTSNAKDVETWIIDDKILPWVKSTLIDGISRFTLNGHGGYSTGTPSSSRPLTTRYSYDNPQGSLGPQTRVSQPYQYGVKDTGDLVIRSVPGENGISIAKRVLATLDEIMSQFERVRVMDFYDACGVTGLPECQNYGWTDIKSAQVMAMPNGDAWIAMPTPRLLR